MNDLSPRRDYIGNAYAGTTYVYLDIETIPTQDPIQIEAIKANAKPPAAMKKAETIDAWRAEQGAAAGDDAEWGWDDVLRALSETQRKLSRKGLLVTK